MSLKSRLARVSSEVGLGPSALFNLTHVIAAVLAIGDTGILGRIRLSREIGLGLGSTRTLMGRLVAEGLVKVEAGGCTLTEAGQEAYHQLRRRVSALQEVDSSGLGIGRACTAALIKGAYRSLGSVTEIRDTTLRYGADGAMIFAYSNKRLFLPSMPEMTMLPEVRSIAEKLIGLFNPRENDIILVCGAEKSRTAQNALMAAAFSLLTKKHQSQKA